MSIALKTTQPTTPFEGAELNVAGTSSSIIPPVERAAGIALGPGL